MYQNLGNFIDGKWSNNTKEKISVVNPCNEELLGTIPSSKEKDLDQALQSAKKAMESWRKTSPWERSKIIKKIASIRGKKVKALSLSERRAEQRDRNKAIKALRSALKPKG